MAGDSRECFRMWFVSENTVPVSVYLWCDEGIREREREREYAEILL